MEQFGRSVVMLLCEAVLKVCAVFRWWYGMVSSGWFQP